MSVDNPTGKAVSHFRNVKVERQNPKYLRILVNTGSSPVEPKTEQGVPIYIHDYYGPNRHAKIEATNAKDFGADGLKYHDEPLVTGRKARVTEVSDIDFPQLLDPVDDLPPTTVVAHVQTMEEGKLRVSGTTADNGAVERVLVDGQEAQAVTPNFAQWEIVLSVPEGGSQTLEASAEDAAGNVEKYGHRVVVK